NSAVYSLSRMGARVTGGTLILLAFLIATETVVRKVMNVSVGGVSELASYSLALVTAWGSAFALFEKAHIRVDTLLLVLPTPLVMVLDFIGLISFIVFITI